MKVMYRNLKILINTPNDLIIKMYMLFNIFMYFWLFLYKYIIYYIFLFVKNL